MPKKFPVQQQIFANSSSSESDEDEDSSSESSGDSSESPPVPYSPSKDMAKKCKVKSPLKELSKKALKAKKKQAKKLKKKKKDKSPKGAKTAKRVLFTEQVSTDGPSSSISTPTVFAMELGEGYYGRVVKSSGGSGEFCVRFGRINDHVNDFGVNIPLRYFGQLKEFMKKAKEHSKMLQ